MGMEAVDKIVGDAPCKGCAERSAGCHGRCKRFAAWKDRRMSERKTYFKENGGDLEQDKYVMESYRRMQRFKGKKVKER